MPELIRLDKFLANNKIGSRKEVSTLVKKGAVAINGALAKRADEKISPESDIITVNGKKIEYSKFLYIMMNKPKGVLSATEDGKGKTVLDIVPEEWKRKGLFPAGRLDKNTTGLLIITDDGETAHKMLSPKSHVYKIYEAILDSPVDESHIEIFKSGIKTEISQFLPAEMWWENSEDKCRVKVRIREGKFHQVKRMFAYCEKTVLELKRLSIGALELDSALPEGECRLMTEQELQMVFFGKVH